MIFYMVVTVQLELFQDSYFVDGVSQLGDPSEEAATADAYNKIER